MNGSTEAAQRMIDEIDKRISSLKVMRAGIMEQFLSGVQPAHTAAVAGATKEGRSMPAVKPRKRRRYTTTAKAPQADRKAEMHKWLLEHPQGATRQELFVGSGIPLGTIGAYLSANQDLFENREGRWFAK